MLKGQLSYQLFDAAVLWAIQRPIIDCVAIRVVNVLFDTESSRRSVVIFTPPLALDHTFLVAGFSPSARRNLEAKLPQSPSDSFTIIVVVDRVFFRPQ